MPQVIELQKRSFPHMVSDGEIWRQDELEKYLKVFPEGQFCAVIDDRIVGSASSLIISSISDNKNHTWDEICYNDITKTFNPNGETLYDVDISTDPAYRRSGIGTRLYEARKDLAKRLNLKKFHSAARLSNYSNHKNLLPEVYVNEVLLGNICEPVLNFQLKNGFRFVKILSNYMKDAESCNFAALTEWANPNYITIKQNEIDSFIFQLLD